MTKAPANIILISVVFTITLILYKLSLDISPVRHGALWLQLTGFGVGLLVKILGIAYVIKAILMKKRLEQNYLDLAGIVSLATLISTSCTILIFVITKEVPAFLPWRLVLNLLGLLLIILYLKKQSKLSYRPTLFIVLFAHFPFII